MFVMYIYIYIYTYIHMYLYMICNAVNSNEYPIINV